MLTRKSRITFLLIVAAALLTAVGQAEAQASRRVYKLDGVTRFPAITDTWGCTCRRW